MSVYVLLVVKDPEQAKDLVAYVAGQGAACVPGVHQDAPNLYYPAKVWGAWQKPSQYCICRRRSGFTRRADYGWWVCSECNNPTRMWASGVGWDSVLGANLLPEGIGEHPSGPPPKGAKVWNDIIEDGEES